MGSVKSPPQCNGERRSKGRVRSSERINRGHHVGSPSGNGLGENKVMSLKQVKDVINEIFNEKFKHDQRCLEA